MILTRVESSMIYAVGYDDACERMEVVYFNGVYRYYDVPRNVYEGLLIAESKGRYMHAHVLDRYPYRQLDTLKEEDEENAREDEEVGTGEDEWTPSTEWGQQGEEY